MNKKIFIEEVEKLGVVINNKELLLLDEYYNLLLEWNNKFNLTRIIEEEDVYLKHFYDSLCIVKTNQITNSILNLCDFGTGAGFPGIVIKIFFPKIFITLVESNSKKCEFLREVINKLKLENIEVINNRTEIYAKDNREKFDIVTCRAVSSLKIICELAIPLVKVNGYFISYKSSIEEEQKEAQSILMELNSRIEKTISYVLPIEKSIRNIIIIKKNSATNKKYPREYNKIKKN